MRVKTSLKVLQGIKPINLMNTYQFEDGITNKVGDFEVCCGDSLKDEVPS
jgi:hypothetical protein